MKIKAIQYVTTALFLFLLVYLFKLQIIDHSRYRLQSERNRIRPVMLEAPRGRILDRQGKELVVNRLSFDCYTLPQNLESWPDTVKRLSRILKVSPEEIVKRYESRRAGPFRPVLLAEDIGKTQAIQIEEESERLQGIFIRTRPIREYLLGSAAAHVVGYIGAIGPAEYKRMRNFGYKKRDWIGRDGVEKTYNSYIRGRHGASQIEVDSLGRLLRVLSIQEREKGKEISLTLDADLQKYASGLMKRKKGGLAIMELEHGGILALVSEPAFDPNIFVQPRMHSQEIHDVLNDSERPLVNRMVAGEYPPGSTFKFIVAIAGLDSGRIRENTNFFCPGSFSIGGFEFRCWRKSGHGSQGLMEALEHSCNVFFYQLGKKVGASVLEKKAHEFGLGEVTGIDIPQERGGLVPGPDWKKKEKKTKWYEGDTLNFSIGQGYLLTTPLQMLRATAVLATGGKRFTPYLVQSIDDVDVSLKTTPQIKLRQEHLDLIREGMKQVVESPTGTGQRARSSKVSISGKTGTAQAPHGKDHAWFVGYAPTENPQVAVVVFLEHGGKGGYAAAPIARKVFEWLEKAQYLTHGSEA